MSRGSCAYFGGGGGAKLECYGTEYKFRVRYAGQQTTCGYCDEKDHLERDCKIKENMIILTKNSKIERQLAKNPIECSFENEQPEPLPTLEEAKQSFEDVKRKDSTPEKREEEEKIEQKSTSNHTERQYKQRLWETLFI